MGSKMRSCFGEYGALELKRSYQRNLTLGTAISAAILTLAALGLGFLGRTDDDPVGRRMILVRTIAQLTSPPPPPALAESPSALPAGGLFRAVANARETQTLSKGRYYGRVYGMVYDGSAAGAVAGSDSAGYVHIGVPSIQSLSRITLVETDRMPECINAVLPPYPESAKDGGIEGEVWLQVLVDEHGNVAEVHVIRKSRADAGFEQAAMDAALRWKYRPALCNRKPVAVWIMYTLRFQLTPSSQSRVSRRDAPRICGESPKLGG
jgi:TonB family protein